MEQVYTAKNTKQYKIQLFKNNKEFYINSNLTNINFTNIKILVNNEEVFFSTEECTNIFYQIIIYFLYKDKVVIISQFWTLDNALFNIHHEEYKLDFKIPLKENLKKIKIINYNRINENSRWIIDDNELLQLITNKKETEYYLCYNLINYNRIILLSTSLLFSANILLKNQIKKTISVLSIHDSINNNEYDNIHLSEFDNFEPLLKPQQLNSYQFEFIYYLLQNRTDLILTPNDQKNIDLFIIYDHNINISIDIFYNKEECINFTDHKILRSYISDNS